jgi:peptidoglycan/LPS O-acetylase OafA/YrhL
MSPEGKSRRLIEVDRCTGFAICLVVIGHVVAREPPAGNDWYVELKFLIYQFHMPLFMFLSGLVFGHTHQRISSLSDYALWVSTRARRLVPGFLLVAVLIAVGKASLDGWLHVDNVDSELGFSLLQIFFHPTESVAASLWYIYVLLEFYLLFPILMVAFGRWDWGLLVLTIAMHFAYLWLQVPRVLALHAVCEYAVYFWIGGMACRYYDGALALLRRRGWIFLILFIVSFSTSLILPWPFPKSVIGLASIPAVMFLVGLRGGAIGAGFVFISGYVFVIYLFNTMVIGFTKGLLLTQFSWDGTNFYSYAVVLTIAGLFVPILAYQQVFSRNKVLKAILN